MIRAAMASVADTAIIPMQDLVDLGTEARMNVPASEIGNWAWRMNANAITDDLIHRLKALAEIYGRRTD